MPERLVLDTSAAIGLLRDEPLGDAVIRHLRTHVGTAGEVSVPSHFWLEVANVLIRRYRHSPDEVVERVRVLDEFAIQTTELDRSLWLLALDRMLQYGLSSYDAAYLALAEATGARLLTLDASLAAAAGSRAIPVGPHRLSEERSRYVTRDPGEVWAQFGIYLAELRREAAAG